VGSANVDTPSMVRDIGMTVHKKSRKIVIRLIDIRHVLINQYGEACAV